MNSLGNVMIPVTGGTNPEAAAELAQGSAGHQIVLESSSAWPHTLLTPRAGQTPPRYLLVPFQTSQHNTLWPRHSLAA